MSPHHSAGQGVDLDTGLLDGLAADFVSEQLPACRFLAPASCILHSFAKVWVLEVCIQ